MINKFIKKVTSNCSKSCVKEKLEQIGFLVRMLKIRTN